MTEPWGWQPSGTEPRTGDKFMKDHGSHMMTWRWRSYSPTGRYGRKGIDGRFQFRAKPGGWHNSMLPDGRWILDRWGQVVDATLKMMAPKLAAAITRGNALLAHLERRGQ